MLVATMLATPLSASAQQASSPVQTVSATVPAVEVLPDAQRPANAWVAGNPDRIAISVRLGSENRDEMISNLPTAMDYQFGLRGKTGIRYFWEDGTSRATAFAIHSDAYVAGPLTFSDPANVVSEVEKVVRLSDGKATDYASALDAHYE